MVLKNNRIICNLSKSKYHSFSLLEIVEGT